MQTPNSNIDLLAQAQAQKHVTMNEALLRLDALMPGQVASATSIPSSPVDGAAYIAPDASITGVAAGEVILRIGGAWHQITPQVGWRLRAIDDGIERIYDGVAWRSLPGLARASVTLTMTGATMTATALIPARTTLLGVSATVVTDVTGATSFDVGDGTTADRFGAAIALTAGTEAIGLENPTAIQTATDVVLTANGGAFSGGTVRVTTSYITLGS